MNIFQVMQDNVGGWYITMADIYGLLSQSEVAFFRKIIKDLGTNSNIIEIGDIYCRFDKFPEIDQTKYFGITRTSSMRDECDYLTLTPEAYTISPYLGRQWPGNTFFDLLLIDSSEHLEDLVGEYNSWIANLKDSGKVVFILYENRFLYEDLCLLAPKIMVETLIKAGNVKPLIYNDYFFYGDVISSATLLTSQLIETWNDFLDTKKAYCKNNTEIIYRFLSNLPAIKLMEKEIINECIKGELYKQGFKIVGLTAIIQYLLYNHYEQIKELIRLISPLLHYRYSHPPFYIHQPFSETFFFELYQKIESLRVKCPHEDSLESLSQRIFFEQIEIMLMLEVAYPLKWILDKLDGKR